MQARTLLITEKTQTPGSVRPSDFRVREGELIDPQIVLRRPNISLYCLDPEKRQALFVETPPGVDLSAAPFTYQTQYEAAQRLIALPYETLHTLAEGVTFDPSRLILIYSIGRCGSTLVSRALGQAEGVESLSEPDVFTQMLGIWGIEGLQDPELAALVKSCTKIQCVPGKSRGATTWALKFRSFVIALGELFYVSFPEAKVIFVYRRAESWARSMARMAGAADLSAPVPVSQIRARWGRVNACVDARETITGIERYACRWVSDMERCLAMQRRGIPMFVARYEELQEAPHAVLTALFAYCGLPVPTADVLDRVLSQDSQEGSTLSRTNLSASGGCLSQEQLDQLLQLITEYSAELTGDFVIPGTYMPPKRESATS